MKSRVWWIDDIKNIDGENADSENEFWVNNSNHVTIFIKERYFERAHDLNP